MTNHTYHPVSLATLRGSLQAQGFNVMRIRCRKPANDDRSWADYAVHVTHQGNDMCKLWSPFEVERSSQACFAKDVLVTAVDFLKDHWVVYVRTQLGEESRPHLPGMSMIDQEPRQPLGGDFDPEDDQAMLTARDNARLAEDENPLTLNDYA